MKIKFNSVQLHNFGSYRDSTIDLTDRGFCAVSGKNNYAKDNASSNGSGKSFIWSAINWSLTGETVQGLTTNLKNINIEDDDTCWVTLDFEVDADHYVITRHHKPKSDLKIELNDTDISGKGIRESEVVLAEHLPDLNKNLISSTIIIGQSMPNKFSAHTPSGRKELLEKLSKSDFMIEDIKEKLAERQIALGVEKRTYEDIILKSNTQIETISRQIEAIDTELTTAVRPNFDQEITEATEKLNKTLEQINNLNKVIAEHEQELDAINARLYKISEEKSAQITAMTDSYNVKANEIRNNLSAVQSKIYSLTAEINKLKSIKDVCPTCGQKIPGAVKPDTTELEANLAKEQAAETSLKQDQTAANAKYNEYLKQINETAATNSATDSANLSTTKQAIVKAKNDLNVETSTEKTLQSTLAKLTFDRDNFDKRLESLKQKRIELDKNVSEIKSDLGIADAALATVNDRLAVGKKMDTLVKRDFRTYLLTNVIAFMDKTAKDLSEKVFETRELDITMSGNALDITYCGKALENLSGGERQRVDLILQLAIRELLCKHFNYSSNIIVLDEIFDNLDRKATDKVVELITSSLTDVESIFIISHHADELNLPIDTELHVVKDATGISSAY